MRLVESAGVVGGGGARGLELAGWAVELPSGCAAALRRGSPSVSTRVERGNCLIALRCVPEDADEVLLSAVLAAGVALRATASVIEVDSPCT